MLMYYHTISAIKEIEHFCKNFVAFKNLEVGNCVNVVNSEMAKTPRRFKKKIYRKILKYLKTIKNPLNSRLM